MYNTTTFQGNIMIRTSENDPLRIAELPLGKGFVGLTLCPGKKDKEAMTGPCRRSLEADLQVIKDWGAGISAAYDRGYGDDELYADLVKCYLYGWGVEAKPAKASHMVDALHDEVRREGPQALYLLGLVYHEASLDRESGLKCLHKAAEKGHAAAVAFLKEYNA